MARTSTKARPTTTPAIRLAKTTRALPTQFAILGGLLSTNEDCDVGAFLQDAITELPSLVDGESAPLSHEAMNQALLGGAR